MRWLPYDDFHLNAGACFNSSDYSRRVRFTTIWDRAVAIAIRGKKARSCPDGIESDLQLAIGEGAVEACDDSLYSFCIFAKCEPCLEQLILERFFANHKQTPFR